MTFQAKAVILDMDGTMLNHVNEISETLTDFIKWMRKQGNIIFIATGRTMKEISEILPAELEVDGIVCANGMAVYEGSRQILNHTLDPDLVDQLVDKAREKKVYYEVHPVDGWGVSLQKDNSYFHEHISGSKPETVKEDEWLARREALKKDIEWNDTLPVDRAAKIYFFNRDKEKNKEWKQLLEQVKLTHDFSSFSSSEHNVEVMEKNISKATGIQYLLDKFDLKAEETMMIGDSENDLPLMEIAGHSVAMKNAPYQVKEQADEVTESGHREDGLYRFLHKKFG